MENFDRKVKTEKELLMRNPHKNSTIGGIIVSFFFMAIGGAIIAVAMEKIKIDGLNIRISLDALRVTGGLFFGLGFLAGLQTIVGYVKQMKIHLRRNAGFSAWDYEFMGKSRGVRGDYKYKIIQSLIFSSIVAAIFFAVYTMYQQHKGFVLLIVMCVLGLIVLLGVGSSIYAFIQKMKYGKSFFSFNQFPFFLGETVEGELQFSVALGNIKDTQLILRCIKEEISKSKEQAGTACFEIYSETITIRDELQHNRDTPIPIYFSLPNDGLSTNLTTDPLCYWELEMIAETKGVNFQSTYMVPVYKKKS